MTPHHDIARHEPHPFERGRHVGRVISALGWGITGLAMLGVYENVLSDDTALRAETAQLARQHAACGERCRVTQSEIHRSLLEYHADYEIEGMSTVRVTCRRPGVAVGAEECRVE